MKLNVAIRCLILFMTIAVASAGASGPVEACGCGTFAANVSRAGPTFNKQFQVRDRRVWAKVTHVPGVAEAAIMAQCDPGVDNFCADIDRGPKCTRMAGLRLDTQVLKSTYTTPVETASSLQAARLGKDPAGTRNLTNGVAG